MRHADATGLLHGPAQIELALGSDERQRALDVAPRERGVDPAYDLEIGRQPGRIAVVGGAAQRANSLWVVPVAPTFDPTAFRTFRFLDRSIGGADELAGYSLAIGTAWGLGAALLDRATQGRYTPGSTFT